MTVGHEPTLLAAMATSRETRVSVGLLVVAVVVSLVIGSWAWGAHAATEARFDSIEQRISEDRGERRSAELDVRDVLARLTQIETALGLQREDMARVRSDVAAIRDAVAPLPKAGK